MEDSFGNRQNVSIIYLIQRVLWVDCIGAFVTGLAMLFVSGWLSVLYGLSPEFVVGHAFAHLIYGTYSFSLAVRKQRPMSLLLLLIFGNAAWAAFCLVIAESIFGDATVFAVAHLILEGIYVGALATIEWNWRKILLNAG